MSGLNPEEWYFEIGAEFTIGRLTVRWYRKPAPYFRNLNAYQRYHDRVRLKIGRAGRLWLGWRMK